MRIALMPGAYAGAVGGVQTLAARRAQRFVRLGREVEVGRTCRPPAAHERDAGIVGQVFGCNRIELARREVYERVVGDGR